MTIDQLTKGFSNRRRGLIGTALRTRQLEDLTRSELGTIAARLGIYVPVRRGTEKIRAAVLAVLPPT